MARVICKLPNASEKISGIGFASHAAGGMVSEEISDEQAATFCSIPGYELFDPKAYAEAQKKNKGAGAGGAAGTGGETGTGTGGAQT